MGQEKADGIYFADSQKQLNVELREEAQAIRDKFDHNRNNDAYLLEQMVQKRDNVEMEKEEEMTRAEMSKQWMGDDDAIYEQYAHLCLDEYISSGKNPRPVELLLQKELNPKRL